MQGPNSWWGGLQDEPYTDLFHLYPTDGYVNGQRGNFALDEVINPVLYNSSNYSLKGRCKNLKNQICFEPPLLYKGDFARSYFYFSIRYFNNLKCCNLTNIVNKWIIDPIFENLLKKRNVIKK
jgi:endonuclease I